MIVRVEVPEGVPATVGLPPPEPLPVIPAQAPVKAARTTAPRAAMRRRLLANAVTAMAAKAMAYRHNSCHDKGPRRNATGGAKLVLGAVVKVTVAVEAVKPFRVTTVGEAEQVELVGAPLQARETAWLNPPMGFTLIVNVAD